MITPLRLTILDVLKLVIFSALAVACLRPMLSLLELGSWTLGEVLISIGHVVPMAWMLLVLLLYRKGPARDWWMMALAAVWMGFALVGSVAFVGPMILELFGKPWSTLRADPILGRLLNALLVVLVGHLVLAAGLVFLLLGIVPRRCPSCRRRGDPRSASSGL